MVSILHYVGHSASILASGKMIVAGSAGQRSRVRFQGV